MILPSLNKEEVINSPLKKLNLTDINKLFLVILALSVILGGTSGYLLAKTGNSKTESPITTEKPKSAQQDTRTFRDFASGVIQKRPAPKNPQDYIEGTHFLIREGAVPVALTSSVIDLTQYEGKKAKIFGETQKAIKEGWLMDVGKIEVEE